MITPIEKPAHEPYAWPAYFIHSLNIGLCCIILFQIIYFLPTCTMYINLKNTKKLFTNSTLVSTKYALSIF